MRCSSWRAITATAEWRLIPSCSRPSSRARRPATPRPLRGDRTLLDLRGARATVTVVLDRPRIIAEPSRVPGADEVLTEAALDFLAELHERFDRRRRVLLDARLERQARFDAGELPD